MRVVFVGGCETGGVVGGMMGGVMGGVDGGDDGDGGGLQATDTSVHARGHECTSREMRSGVLMPYPPRRHEKPAHCEHGKRS